jgi:hypothetical protein
MSEHLNTYSACEIHKNGHADWCRDCQEEHLRGLLRQVANCAVEKDDPEFNFLTLQMPEELWIQILPLRTAQLHRTRYEMTDAATATGMYDDDPGG